MTRQHLGLAGGTDVAWQRDRRCIPKRALIDVLPGYPVISAPVAAAVTGRSKPQIYEALEQLQAAAVLVPLSASRRNRSWEVDGLLGLLERLEAGQLPQ